MASPIAKFPARSRFVVEKGVPLPHVKSSGLPIEEMSVGDSFFVDLALSDITRRAIEGALRRYERRVAKQFSTPVKFTIRKVHGGLRVWRTK